MSSIFRRFDIPKLYQPLSIVLPVIPIIIVNLTRRVGHYSKTGSSHVITVTHVNNIKLFHERLVQFVSKPDYVRMPLGPKLSRSSGGCSPECADSPPLNRYVTHEIVCTIASSFRVAGILRATDQFCKQ
jgi:hypothetical protein